MDVQDMTAPGDFRVTITWEGAEDKPFYKALLVSASRPAEIQTLRPFWDGSVITDNELSRIVDAVTASEFAWRDGAFPHSGRGYVIQIEEPHRVTHAALGVGSQTLTALRAIEAALLPEHRRPLTTILARVEKTMESAGSARV